MSEHQASEPLPTHSTVTCPECGHKSREQMPTDACTYFYECTGCSVLLKPDGSAAPGACACIFCLYGDVPCPPVLAGDKGC